MNIRVTFSTLLVTAGVALAAQPQPTPDVVYQPVTEHIFDPESVHGGVESPDATPESVRLRQPLPSLVQIRTDFQRELLQSAEDI